MADYKAIVTGGAKGIGHGITSALLEAGGKVYMYKSRIYKFISCVILLIPSMVTRFHDIRHIHSIILLITSSLIHT